MNLRSAETSANTIVSYVGYRGGISLINFCLKVGGSLAARGSSVAEKGAALAAARSGTDHGWTTLINLFCLGKDLCGCALPGAHHGSLALISEI